MFLVLASLAGRATPAAAQYYVEFDENRPLQDVRDPLARSTRLLGMGRLQYALDDVHNRVSLWDLGGNPIGVIDADTSSTVEFDLVNRSASIVGDKPGVEPRYQRQSSAASEFRSFGEAWRRTSTSTYGLVGDFSTYQIDQPLGDNLEQRMLSTRPGVMPILAGRIPHVSPMTYAIRGYFASELRRDEFHFFYRNAAGEYINKNGTRVSAPGQFVPDEFRVHVGSIGTALGYDLGKTTKAAIAVDFTSPEYIGRNEGDRSTSEIRDSRPFRVGQASLVGKLGSSTDWGVDGKGWTANSTQTWVYSTSAGVAVPPLQGRGNLQERKEEGSALKARARWHSKALELGAGIETGYRKVELTPSTDPTNFNLFLNTVFHRPGADTLALPDSASINTIEDRSWNVGGGGAWHLKGGHAVVGLEGSYYSALRSTAIAGKGPEQVGWDVRSGVEYVASRTLTLRGGYIYRWQDQDKRTELNELTLESFTLGFSLSPSYARWGLDAALAHSWGAADYNDPRDPTSTGQNFSGRIRWLF